jgi:myo-inositol-1(or 4)-monophosphatase
MSPADPAIMDLREMLRIAHEALDRARRDRGRDGATWVDGATEQSVRAHLGAVTPDVPVVAAEDVPESRIGTWWAISAIDEPATQSRRSACEGVAVVLVRDGRPVLAVIDLHATRYSALEGVGADRDGRPLKVRPTGRLSEALVSVGYGAVGADAGRDNASRAALARRLTLRTAQVRTVGSPALELARLADGRIDASVTFSNLFCEVAAGVVIARAAGAWVVDADGDAFSAYSDAAVAARPPIGPE